MPKTQEFSKDKWTQLDIFDLNGCRQMLRNIDGMTALQKFPIKSLFWQNRFVLWEKLQIVHIQFDLNAHKGLWLK